MIFGDYEYIIIDLDKLVVLPQVRKIKNAKIDEMADSIEDRGLINPLDVARLSHDELQSHISFINGLWKKDVKINSFIPIEDHYYVIIAGHSRLEALKKNAKANKRKDQVSVKIHPAKTSEEILAIQLDENIHTEPRIEERAISIIETYRLGIMNGKWNDKEDFIQKNNNKFSRRVLNDALFFADLPLEVQEYVFSNNIAYAVGVELGKLRPLIEKYEADFNQDETNLDKYISFHYASLLMKLQKTKSIKRSLSLISAHSKHLNEHFNPNENFQQEMFDWFMDSPDRQAEMHRNQLMSEYNKACQSLNSLPFEYFLELLGLDSTLTGQDHSIDIKNLQNLYNEYLQKRFFNSELSKKKK